MANEYSVAIHHFISEKIDDAREQLARAEETGDRQKQLYWNGHLEEFSWIRTYLKEHVDLKDFVYYKQVPIRD